MFMSWITFGRGALLLAAVATACSCSMTQEEQASQAASSMQKTRAEVQKTSDQIDVTLKALNDLVEKPQANLRPQYQAFTGTIEGLKAQANLVKTRADEMRAQGTAYFKDWEQDPDAPISPELKASYGNIAGEFTKARDAFNPFLDSLADIQKFLGMDLTGSGIVGVGDLAKQANANGAEVKARIQAVSKELDTVAKLLSPAKPAS
jgi:hypothetical protein